MDERRPTEQAGEELAIFLHLARASEMRQRPWIRDKLLVLAGSKAARMGLEQIYAFCRHKVLANNPRHLVRDYPHAQDAAAPDHRLSTYVGRLEREYTREKAEHMLGRLNIQLAAERDTYYSDEEYAAVLLGTTPDRLATWFTGRDQGEDPSGADAPPAEPAAAVAEAPLPRAARSHRPVIVAGLALTVVLAAAIAAIVASL